MITSMNYKCSSIYPTLIMFISVGAQWLYPALSLESFPFMFLRTLVYFNGQFFFDAKNRLNWHQDKALFAQPEYDKWWEIWEDEGWVSLGRVRDFDWMHVQAVRLKGM